MKFIFTLLALLCFALHAETINLTPKNTVSLSDVVMTESVTDVIRKLSVLEANDEPVIYLVLDTPGGSVFSGLNLIQFLRGYKKPVKTISLFAASMGFQIARGNPGDRLITDTGTLMSHPVSGGEYGEFGDWLSIDNRNAWIKQIIDTMDNTVVARTNGKQTKDSYKKAYAPELWVTGKTAVDSGFADSVVAVSCSSELNSSSEKVEYRRFLGSESGLLLSLDIKYEFSRCPLSNSLSKFQVALVDVIRNRRFIIINSGYDAGDSVGTGDAVFRELPNGVDTAMKNDIGYKNLMFRLNRNFSDIKSTITFTKK